MALGEIGRSLFLFFSAVPHIGLVSTHTAIWTKKSRKSLLARSASFELGNGGGNYVPGISSQSISISLRYYTQNNFGHQIRVV